MIELRPYQRIAADSIGLDLSKIVVLDPGTGKTEIAMDRAKAFLDSGKRVLLVTPTIALTNQQAQRFKEFTGVEPAFLSLLRKRDDRVQAVKTAGLVACVPHALVDQTTHDRVSPDFAEALNQFDVAVLDEVHNAVGNQAMAVVARHLRDSGKKILTIGLTASPGYTFSKIEEIKKNLGVNDVFHIPKHEIGEYMPIRIFGTHHVNLPDELREMASQLEAEAKMIVANFLADYVPPKAVPIQREMLVPRRPDAESLVLNQSLFLKIKKRLDAERAEASHMGDSQRRELGEAASYLAEAQSLYSRAMYTRSDGTGVLAKGLTDVLSGKGGKPAPIWASRLAKKPWFKLLVERARKAEAGWLYSHPKFDALGAHVVRELEEGLPVLVYVFRKDTADKVKKFIEEELGMGAESVSVLKGVGEGMTRKQQMGAVEKIRNKKARVLVFTDAGAEGIDIPAANKVILFNTPTTAVKAKQISGRAGREPAQIAYVVQLLTQGTHEPLVYYRRLRQLWKGEKLVEDMAKVAKSKIKPAPERTRITLLPRRRKRIKSSPDQRRFEF